MNDGRDYKSGTMRVPGIGAVFYSAHRAVPSGARVLSALVGEEDSPRAYYMTRTFYGYGARDALALFRAEYAREHRATFGGAA